MRLQKLATFNQKKATVFMDERTEMQEDKEKAIVAMVHEIRNPLTAIKLANQCMQAALDQKELDSLAAQSYITIIANNIARIDSYLTEIMTYKLRETPLEPVNICDCLDQALCDASDRVYLGGILVSKNYKGGHWVYGNEEKLVTAFLNIIVNAIEAIKNGNGKIWITVYENNNSIHVAVKDNGTGMSAATAKRIFDPLFSTKDGIGIGLANVKEIMTYHKAQIVADSLPGVGTSISIVFSSIPEEERPARTKRASGPGAGNP